MTFRTPAEAVALANNTRYGLAASVWSENINLALDVAPKIKAGSVWINCTNLFDASSGFGGYRESGYGREGGKEGLYEYVRPAWEAQEALNQNATENGSTPSTDGHVNVRAHFIAPSDADHENGHSELHPYGENGLVSTLPPID